MNNITKKYILITGFIFTGIFVVSFIVFDCYLNLNKQSRESTETVLTMENSDNLKNDVLITLYKENILEKSIRLSQIKSQLDLSGDVTQAKLDEVLKKKGYNLKDIQQNELIYVRTAKGSIEPNKYYIGKHDDYYAIYKSDSAGNLIIENPSQDIFHKGKKFSQLPENDRKCIENYELKYETRDEAEEAISNYTS